MIRKHVSRQSLGRWLEILFGDGRWVLLLVLLPMKLAGSWSPEFFLPVFGGPATGAKVAAVTWAGTNLYVAGDFRRVGAILAGAGGLEVNGVARWDGHRWHPLGTGLDGFTGTPTDGAVNVVAVDGTNVYVGGTFTLAGGQPASRIARWDGTRWWPLGLGLNGAVHSLLVHDGVVYAGGSFVGSGEVVLNGVGRWDGVQWTALGSGLAPNFRIRSLVAHADRLYAAGNFISVRPGGSLLRGVAQWDGTTWSSLGSGVNQEVNALTVHQGSLIAGGTFSQAGGLPANRIARWDGATWQPLGSGVSGGILSGVSALVSRGDELLVGGTFTTAGVATVSGLARWDGSEWSSLAAPLQTALGMSGSVTTLAVSGSVLTAAGDFGAAEGVTLPGLGEWNGTRWSALGKGVSGPVQAVATSSEGVYLGGQFPEAGGVRVNSVARYRDGHWEALGSGVLSFGVPGLVRSLVVRGQEVFIGGAFTVAGGLPATNVARWTGESWQPLGGGLRGGPGAVVQTLVFAPNGDLIAGGVFNQADGITVRHVARWNGSGWSALGDGLGTASAGAVNALVFRDDVLIAGGSFNQPVPFLARWQDGTWSSLGAAPNASVLCLAVHDRLLYAGGFFTAVGAVAADRIARWEEVGWSPVGSGLGTHSPRDYVAALAVSERGLVAGGVFTNAGPTAVTRIARFDGENWTALGEGVNAGPLGTDPFVNTLAWQGPTLWVGGAFAEVGGLPASGVTQWSTPASETLRLGIAGQPDGRLTLSWESVPGREYQLEASPTADGLWLPQGNVLTATGDRVEISLGEPTENSRWFRLRTSDD
ncbi:MAG: hypothetical protein J0M24_26590 [Verrucomicrobia bacterium]|nr:hypothetical protein [Verrucomicrobiota bacterium]